MLTFYFSPGSSSMAPHIALYEVGARFAAKPVSFAKKEHASPGFRAVNPEGKVPAPETGHAIRAVVDEALAAKESGEERVILFNYSGHGLLDLSAYDDYLNGRLVDA